MPWRLTLPGAIEDRISGRATPCASAPSSRCWPGSRAGGRWSPHHDPRRGDHLAGGRLRLVAEPFPRASACSGAASRRAGGEGHRHARPRHLGRPLHLAEGTAAVGDGVRVVVGVHEGLGEDPAAYRDRVVQALQDLSGRFGGYPWPSFCLALTPEFPGGIEYPGHVMQGPGTIGRTTPHEVGHQWFYALVGNDQGATRCSTRAWPRGPRCGSTGATPRYTSVPADARGRAGAHDARRPTGRATLRGSYYEGVYVRAAQAGASSGTPARWTAPSARYVALRGVRHRRAWPTDPIGAMGPPSGPLWGRLPGPPIQRARPPPGVPRLHR